MAPVATLATVDYVKRTGVEDAQYLSELSHKRRVIVDESAEFGQQRSSLGYHAMLGEKLPGAMFFALAIVWCWRAYPPTGLLHKLLTVAYALGACFLPFLGSSRTGVLFLLVNFLIILNYTGRLSKTILLFGGAAACVLIVGMALIRSERGTPLAEIVKHAPSRVADTLFGSQNFLEITKTTAIYRGVPQLLGYKYGETYLAVLYAPIPRLLYPDKPAVRPGPEFSEKIYGHRHGEGGAIEPAFVGELIWNFGVGSVGLGALVYGAFLRVMYNTFVPYVACSQRALLVYTAILVPCTFTFIGFSFSGTIMRVASFVLISAIILWSASDKRG